MLIRFRVRNHRSLRDEQVLNLTKGPRSDAPAFAGPQSLELLHVAGIYGANASGKSNVLNALDFMTRAIANSHVQWPAGKKIQRAPFQLDEHARRAPSEYELDFLWQGRIYSYGFQLDSQRILAEWLVTYPRGRKVRLFDRADESQFRFGKSLHGPNQTIRKLTRPNSLFLSCAAQNNHPLLSDIQAWLTTKVRYQQPVDSIPVLTAMALRKVKHKERTLALLRAADLGIVDFSVEERKLSESTQSVVNAVLGMTSELVGRTPGDLSPPPSRVPVLRLHHRSAGHAGGVPLLFEAESYGTRMLVGLSQPLLETLDEGGVLFVDELDASLHPTLIQTIVRLFQDEHTNPEHAQLIFNANDTSLLHGVDGDATLHRDQVWLTEKDGDGATTLYPLSDFRPRKQENILRGYLQGRYGAVPMVDMSYFLRRPEQATDGEEGHDDEDGQIELPLATKPTE